MIRLRTIIAAIALFASSVAAGERQVIRHHEFDDFKQGTFPDGGTNIYVSKHGAVQLIPRWDINCDGHIDLLLGQDHNQLENVEAFIYWGNKDGYRSLFPAFWQETVPAYKFVREIDERRRSMSFLPTRGGGRIKVADLNGDGLPDIMFLNIIHNYTVHMPAYVYWGGGRGGYSPERRTELPTLFARDLTIADFDRDGHPDVAFANFGNEIGDRWGYRNHLQSYLYYGGVEGFSEKRRADLATISAVSCAAGDFNGDHWPDLAFANNNLKQKSVYVYLGGRQGFSAERRLTLEGGNADLVRAGDVNGDGIDDLLVSSPDAGTAVYFGSTSFNLDKSAVVLPTKEAKDCAVADFNRDGHPDVAFASGAADPATGATQSEVYFGSASGPDPKRKTSLPSLSPSAVDCCDLNGDGFVDLMFANAHDHKTYDVPSYIYWGDAKGFDSARRTQLQGFGAAGIAAADLDHNGVPDVVLANQSSGKLGSHIPSVIFWGNAANAYSEADATLLPADGPNSYKVADLNDDGHPDIILSGAPPRIYWGSASGLTQPTELDVGGVNTLGVAVGDFNRDGWLDIVFSIFDGDPRVPSYGLVFSGSANGYTKQRSTKIALRANRTASNVSAADLNKDGYLDLVFPADETPTKQSEIVWGGPHGFGATPSTLLTTDVVTAPAVADLNRDGWLDLVFPGNMKLDTQDPHTKSLIYWGSSHGFSDDRRAELEACQAQQIIVEDFNHDGHLDLVASNYKSETTRSLPIFIFWGNAEGSYSDQRRTELPAESSCGIQVLDLNGDQFPDIIVHNHIKDGDHGFGSYIYWGGANGYSIERRSLLPTVGTHYAQGISPGNIYDRSPGVEYISPPVAIEGSKTSGRLTCKGETPHATSIRFKVRAAADVARLSNSPWRPVIPNETFPLAGDARFVQYIATLVSPDGGESPILREVVLSLE
jgi:hypothetical protein